MVEKSNPRKLKEQGHAGAKHNPHQEDTHLHKHPHDYIHKHTNIEVEIDVARFTFVVILNLGITLAELVGGIISGSLALISDSAHNFGDALSLILSYVAERVSRKPKNYNKTFGYKRANIIAAFFNSATLLVISGLLTVEAIRRFLEPLSSINANVVLIVATIGLIANFLSMMILKKWSKASLNIRSAYLHMLMDSLSSIAVLIGAVFIKFYGLKFLDSIVTILIALYVVKEAIEIFSGSLSILMESTPVGFNIESISSQLLRNPVIKDIHHVHIWALDERSILFEGHVNLREDVKVSETMDIYNEIKSELEKFGINHVTIQFEYNGCKGNGLISCS
jgi:cobalt-zinc-cadmium efflux system protein